MSVLGPRQLNSLYVVVAVLLSVISGLPERQTDWAVGFGAAGVPWA